MIASVFDEQNALRVDTTEPNSCIFTTKNLIYINFFEIIVIIHTFYKVINILKDSMLF